MQSFFLLRALTQHSFNINLQVLKDITYFHTILRLSSVIFLRRFGVHVFVAFIYTISISYLHFTGRT